MDDPRKERELAKQVACLVVALMIAALVAPFALAQEQAPRLGVVDMAKVLEGYTEFQASDAEYKQFLRDRQGQLQQRMSVRLLRDDELKEYQNLTSVVAPTDDQKRRLEELRALAEKRENELNGLSRLSDPTPEEKQRLTELQAVADKADEEISGLQQRLADEINQRNKELSEKLNQKIEAALAAVAREKRVDYILSKDAVLYGGRDLTDEVLAKLNPSA